MNKNKIIILILIICLFVNFYDVINNQCILNATLNFNYDYSLKVYSNKIIEVSVFKYGYFEPIRAKLTNKEFEDIRNYINKIDYIKKYPTGVIFTDTGNITLIIKGELYEFSDRTHDSDDLGKLVNILKNSSPVEIQDINY